jgi:glycosyltransferase involved in cell wall biosynthesis
MAPSVVIRARDIESATIGLYVRERCCNVRVVFEWEGITHLERAYEMGYRDLTSVPADQRAPLDRERRDLLRCARDADFQVCLSERMREYAISDCGADPSRVEVVGCHVDTRLHKVARTLRCEMRSELGLADKLVVAYCGSVYRRQRIEQGLDLFQRIRRMVPSAHLLVVTHQFDQFCTLLGKFDLTDAATVRSVSYWETPRYLAAADLGMITTGLFEEPVLANQVCCPTKFAEYLACGLPVLMADGIGDCSQIADNHRLGLVIRHDWTAQHVDRALAAFLQDFRETPQEWSQRCRMFAEAELDSERHIARLIDCYARVERGAHGSSGCQLQFRS